MMMSKCGHNHRTPEAAAKCLAKQKQALRALGRIGGKTRARNLTTEQRSESARKAATARWSQKDENNA